MQFDWSATIEGIRPISKKNSRRIFNNRSLPSEAYVKFNKAALDELKDLTPENPYTGDVIVEVEVFIKGDYKVDIDNLCTSWIDTLMDAGVIADDEQVTEIHTYKTRHAKDWRSEIHVVSLE